MSGRRTKLLRSQALDMGFNLTTVQINGKGLPNLFRRIKKNYTNLRGK